MFRNHRVPLASRSVFISRLFRSLAMATVLIALSLAVGVAGYHWIATKLPTLPENTLTCGTKICETAVSA